MNKELIKKFRFEAAEHANNIKPLGITKWNEIRDEKFAELIIRECAKAIDTVYEKSEPDHGCYDWATWAYGEDILNHFGLEL